MGDSNGDYGRLAAVDDELGDVWGGYESLPEPGQNQALDAFVARKNIDIAALVRLGARMSEPPHTIAFVFGTGIKYRDVVTDHRWSYAGSEWSQMKIVPAQHGEARIAIVAEGESDGARLSMLYPSADIAVLPAGADPRPHTARYAAQLAAYDLVLMAHDADTAGNNGAALLSEAIPGKVLRWLSPYGDDWCVSPSGDVPPLPDPDLVEVPVAERLLVRAGDLLDLEPPPIVSFFDNALLPIGGQLVIHGWAKSFKSYLALDLAAAISQSSPWCEFEPLEEPTRVAVMQYEIPWPFYQQRVRQLRVGAADPAAFDENLLTWTPMQRPGYRAGNKAYEDGILKALTDAGVGVFVLDPIRRATGAVDLNSEKDVRPLLEFYERLQGEGIAVITCHHDKKSERGSGDMAAMTGSGAFAGDADSIISVALPKHEDPESAKRDLHFTFRNAPSIAPRGFEMTDTGQISYRTNSWTGDDEQTPDSVDEAI